MAVSVRLNPKVRGYCMSKKDKKCSILSIISFASDVEGLMAEEY